MHKLSIMSCRFGVLDNESPESIAKLPIYLFFALTIPQAGGFSAISPELSAAKLREYRKKPRTPNGMAADF
jgi:hypothetical protein